jgi:ribosomal protein S12 methylthiotransferase accessory factor
VVPAEAVYLISESRMTALSGPSIEMMAPLLDGTRTLAEVRREMSPYLPADAVDRLITRLSEEKLVSLRRPQAAGTRDMAAEAYWDLADVDTDKAVSTVASAHVEVVILGSADFSAAAGACRATGLTVTGRAAEPGAGPEGAGSRQSIAALTLVLCDDYLDPRLGAVNASHLASGRPWLLARTVGADAWVGPVFRPGAGACWTCLAKRLAGNRHGEFLWQRVGAGDGDPPGRTASLAAGRHAGLHMAVLEMTKWLAGYRDACQDTISILNTLELRMTRHPVARRPQCPSCGDPDLVAEHAQEPVRLARRPVAAGGGNGQRIFSLDRMMAQYGHLVDPVTGVVPELRRDPGNPDFVYSYLSGRNRAMTAGSVAALRAGLRSHSGGKGTTEMEAKVGALCEAVERYCATRHGDELIVRDSFLGLGAQAVHPDTCQLFDERQFADRARWNAVCMPWHRVPEPFDEAAVTQWTPVWSLLTGEQRLLPTAMLYYNSHDAGRALASVRADSNGNASGGTVEDAILHGFFELVERDAVALWWYNRSRQPAVRLESFDDPWITGIPERYTRLNREIWVIDVTSDLGIPVMVAVSRRTDKPAEDIMFGFGAHFDPRVAVRRALTELGQLLSPVANAGPGDTGYGSADPHLKSWWTRATISKQPYLVPDPAAAERTEASYGYVPADELDIGGVCSIARRAGLDLLVLDQTRPDIGMPVVKVIAPGLRHFWPRFAAGRLFDVPVRLGRLADPTPYEYLNPIPVFT